MNNQVKVHSPVEIQVHVSSHLSLLTSMTNEQFDRYLFSVETEVKFFEDVWDKITEVDFDRRWVGVERGQIVEAKYIKEIRN